MSTTEATRLLEQFRAGKISREKVLHAFQAAPVADLGFAQVDTHRALRKNFPEVIFGAGKTPDQVVKIATKLLEHGQQVLITRITADHARALRKKFKRAVHHALACCVTIETKPLPKRAGFIAVPTSIGYGASFGGIAALLAMLNSCASGVTVVNIDNGFGAGFAASQINALCSGGL